MGLHSGITQWDYTVGLHSGITDLSDETRRGGCAATPRFIPNIQQHPQPIYNALRLDPESIFVVCRAARGTQQKYRT